MATSLETAGRIEPCFPERYSPELVEVVSRLSRKAELLGSRLAPATAADLADVVRLMNCYYSNLIEGHNTRPRDIERALEKDLEANPERRNLQLEARAHVRVQQKLDQLHSEDRLPEPASVDFIRWLHREFYQDAPESLLTVGEGARRFRMTPGEFRQGSEQDVAVGRHLPPSSERLSEFMRHFEERYRFASLPDSQRMVAMASAHHRLNYIHPFADGNGRVSRLMSHAMALKAGAGAHGLWSVSRGLARGRNDRGEYKRMMDLADMPRQGDLDGRGNLSLHALEEFVQWFLEIALDQVEFMTELFSLEGLVARLRSYALDALHLRAESADLLEEVLRRGELARGEVPRITHLAERTARQVLSELLELGMLQSTSPKGLVSLRFPVKSHDVLFPRLFQGG